MAGPDSGRPQLNVFGKTIVGCVFAGVATPLVGGPVSLAAGFFGVAAVVTAVSMRKTRTDDGRRSDDDDAGTDDTEMKAKAMVGGANGSDGG